MDRLDTRTAERAEPDTAGRPGRADAQNDHDARVIHHYATYTEDFYQDHHDEHIHFGYWGAADAAAACERIDRSALPAALHRLIEVVAAPAGIQANPLRRRRWVRSRRHRPLPRTRVRLQRARP